jgi:hypothetical protein
LLHPLLILLAGLPLGLLFGALFLGSLLVLLSSLLLRLFAGPLLCLELSTLLLLLFGLPAGAFLHLLLRPLLFHRVRRWRPVLPFPLGTVVGAVWIRVSFGAFLVRRGGLGRRRDGRLQHHRGKGQREDKRLESRGTHASVTFRSVQYAE